MMWSFTVEIMIRQARNLCSVSSLGDCAAAAAASLPATFAGVAVTVEVAADEVALELLASGDSGEAEKNFQRFSCVLLRQIGSEAATLKSLRNKVAKRLEEEMKATNNSLFATFVEISASEAPASAHNGIVLSCTYLGKGLSRDWGALKPQPYLVYLTILLSYPANSPDIWFDESTPQVNQTCFMGAREKFLEVIRGLPAPLLVSTIARMWNTCAQNALVEYASIGRKCVAFHLLFLKKE